MVLCTFWKCSVIVPHKPVLFKISRYNVIFTSKIQIYVTCSFHSYYRLVFQYCIIILRYIDYKLTITTQLQTQLYWNGKNTCLASRNQRINISLCIFPLIESICSCSRVNTCKKHLQLGLYHLQNWSVLWRGLTGSKKSPYAPLILRLLP